MAASRAEQMACTAQIATQGYGQQMRVGVDSLRAVGWVSEVGREQMAVEWEAM